MTFQEFWANPWDRLGLALTLYAVIIIALVLIADRMSNHTKPAPDEEELKIKRQAKRMKALRAKIKHNRVRR